MLRLTDPLLPARPQFVMPWPALRYYNIYGEQKGRDYVFHHIAHTYLLHVTLILISGTAMSGNRRQWQHITKRSWMKTTWFRHANVVGVGTTSSQCTRLKMFLSKQTFFYFFLSWMNMCTIDFLKNRLIFSLTIWIFYLYCNNWYHYGKATYICFTFAGISIVLEPNSNCSSMNLHKFHNCGYNWASCRVSWCPKHRDITGRHYGTTHSMASRASLQSCVKMIL